MSPRELVALGTAAQVPTRERNHNGYLLRWDGEAVLFDPGEGTQRQLLLAGVSPAAVTRICITHAHGDHCLGLPGVLQRLALDRPGVAVDLHFPAGMQPYVDRLRNSSAHQGSITVHEHPVSKDGEVVAGTSFTLQARFLDHRVETVGWRVQEPPGRRMLPLRLAVAGVTGPDIGRLQRDGEIEVAGRRVTLAEMSVPRPGQAFAFVMDTRPCPAAVALASDADLVVCEATYLEREAGLAAERGHMTAGEAARLAAQAGTRRLVLTHFSQRYPDLSAFHEETRRYFADVVVARDLDRIPVPARRQVS